MFELKPISREAIPGALEKAERYRLLNEPREAESICRDVLRTDPENQEAVATMLLSLTDQFAMGGRVSVTHAQELLARLRDGYSRAYYAGVVCERWAKAQLDGETPGHVVYDWLMQAMKWYEEAEKLRPSGNEDAALRWNACARIIKRHEQVRPRAEELKETSDLGYRDEATDDIPR